jgi:hypothetical protein
LDTQLIITHAGSAHFDEMTAIALVLATRSDCDFKVERRKPAAAELNNADIWVIDIGERYQPELRNFDHHQALDCPASFVLLAQYLGLFDILCHFPWWDFKDSVDRIGPVQASARFQAGDDLVNRNACEDWLVSFFAANPQEALPILKSYGNHLVQNGRGLKKQIDYWKKARRLKIQGITAMIGETRESFGLEEYRRSEKDPPEVVISMDRRSDGWRLYRYDGTPVDFSILAGSPEIEFAHKNGFLAKTRTKLSEAELIKLIARAVTKT